MTEAHRAKPPHLAADYAAQFGDEEVAAERLLGPHPRRVLELGAGTGDFTIGLAP